jgi:hypothetical protein
MLGVSLISVAWLNNVVCLIWPTTALPTLGETNISILTPLMNVWIIFLANAEWCKAYLATMVYHLPMMRSDHAPILAVLQSNHFRTNKSFKFENWWTLE